VSEPVSPLRGIELSRRFYADLVGPWLRDAFPDLRHAAALIGYGSELLGFDDAMSQDHNWGPRVLIFVSETDFERSARDVVDAFTRVMPAEFVGAPMGFANRPHPSPASAGALGDIRHGLEVWTLATHLKGALGIALDEPRDGLGWLGLSEQRLLTVTAGAVFADDDGRLTALRERLAWFPLDVQLYKLACQWRRIAEEMAFVGRAGRAGDELGSRVIAARLVRDVMRMAFLIERRYAPYPKWFGSAFARLPCAAELGPILQRALAGDAWREREAALAEAYLIVAQLHLERGLPGRFEPRIGRYYERPFTVINADEITGAIAAEIADPVLAALPVIGSLDQVTDSTAVIEAPDRARRAMAALLDDGEAGPIEEP
jgi:hypothetical protein